jgi:hypothetical protein
VLRADEPIAQDFEKSCFAHFQRNVQILRKRAHCPFVHLEEQCVLAAEVLENRALSDSEGEGDIGDPRIFIAMLSEMPGGGVDDAPALGFRTRMYLVRNSGR